MSIMKLKMQLPIGIAAIVLAGFAAAAGAQNTVIEGQLVGWRGEPVKGGEVRIQAAGSKAEIMVARADANGRYAASLPAGIYRVTIRVEGNDLFTAGHVRTRVGDPWRIDYNPTYALATMSTQHSKKVRSFTWIGPHTGSNLDGRWTETTSDTGYEPDADHYFHLGRDALDRGRRAFNGQFE